MKGKPLAILAGTATILVVLAAVSSRERGNATRELMGRSVLEGLLLNDVSSIVIDKDGESTTIAMKEGQWVLPEKYGYPADLDKLRQRLIALVDLKVGQVLDVNETQKGELKLAGAEAGHVRLLAADGSELGALLLGAERQKAADPSSPYGSYPDGRYVSADAGKTALLVADSLSAWTTDPMGWLDNAIVSIPGAEITSIRIRPDDGEALELSRADESGEFALTGIKADEELDNAKLSSVQNALSYLSFDDVADPSLDDAELGFDSALVFEATTRDDSLYIVKVGGSPDNSSARYCRISVSLLQPAPSEGEEEGEAEPPPAEDLAAAKAKVEALNAKLANWTFVVPSYKAESLTCSRADIIKQKEPAADTTEATEATAPLGTLDAAPAADVEAPVADVDVPPEGETDETPAEAGAATGKPAEATAAEPAVVVAEEPAAIDPTPDVDEAVPDESLGMPAPEPIPVPQALTGTAQEGPEPQK